MHYSNRQSKAENQKLRHTSRRPDISPAMQIQNKVPVEPGTMASLEPGKRITTISDKIDLKIGNTQQQPTRMAAQLQRACNRLAAASAAMR